MQEDAVLCCIGSGDNVTCEKFNADLSGTDLERVDEPDVVGRIYLPIIND